MESILKEKNKPKLGEWITVEPIHCHKRLRENTLVSKLKIISEDRIHTELLMKFNVEELSFFFDHEIDHLPGMLQACGLRQCALALAHLVYDVPPNYVTALDWIRIKLYNYGELNKETIVKSTLLDIKKEKNKETIVLEGLMIQNDYPIMRMRGSLLAFSPSLAERLRYRKTSIKDIKDETELLKPLIAELHIVIKKKHWMKAYKEILSVLRSQSISKYSLTPLYATYDEKDTELRICLEFKAPSLIDKFIVDKIRNIPGIDATRIRLTLDGQIFPKGIKALAESNSNYESCHIFLKIDPSKDISVWQALSSLIDTKLVFPTWIFRDFYEYDRDVTLRLMGKSKKDVKGYISKHLESIDGISSYKLKFMSSIEKIIPDEKLMRLAKMWLKEK